MPILIKPYLGCNLRCEYCYEGKHRESYNPPMDYDIDIVLAKMEELNKTRSSSSFGLHGGEPLCMPKQDVERILAKAYELQGGCSVQTNATLVDDDYLTMFKKYNASVGFSLDGPEELNGLRMSVSETNRIMELVHRMVEKENMRVAIMCVIHKSNVGTPELLARFKDWLLELRQLNIGGRLNACGGSPQHQINPIKLAPIFLDLAKFQVEHGMSWSPFMDLVLRVRGEGAVCSYMGCDIYHTSSAFVILGDGSVTGCMRTNPEDITLMHPVKYDTRDELLQEIPQRDGGCRGCSFWDCCHGGCPSMAINDDWRNRTYMCPVNRTLFTYYTNLIKSLKVPITRTAYDRIWKGHPSYAVSVAKKPDRSSSGHQDNHVDFPPKKKRRSVC